MHDAVAIIGVGARFPGATDHVDFKRMVAAATMQAQEIPFSRWDHSQVHSPNPRQANRTPAKQAAFLHDIEGFAPEFFGVTPKRARLMDPQQRLVLELTRQALEDAGYARRILAGGRVGIYVGASSGDHRLLSAARANVPGILAGRLGTAAPLSPEAAEAVLGALPPMGAYSMPGSQLSMIAANVSQAFDFRGPAFTVDTACSSALAALHEAVCHLRAGTVDAALAGGVYVLLDPAMLVCFSRIGALSPTDFCAPFQAAANGFVLGEGAGLFVLKRLADAQREGDRIVAVIRGIAMNNDGRGQGPLTPSAAGQAEAIRQAWADAECDPATVGLLEAHATATPAGDASELAALSAVFAGRVTGTVPISSVKANVGHGLSSAGAASLLKAVQAVEAGVVPAQPVPGALREDLARDHGWLRVSARAEPWQSRAGEPRRAGVSAFGFGGTNVHVVIEQAPANAPRRPSRAGARHRMTIAAPNRDLLSTYAAELARAVRETLPDPADVAFTLAARREDVASAIFCVETLEELIGALEQVARGEAVPPPVPGAKAEGRLVSLPPSPLGLRRFSILDEAKLSRVTGSAREESAPAEEKSVTAENLKARVVAAVCAVTAWRPEEIALSQRFVADLGFDSLTTMEFMTVLGKGLETAPPPRSLFTATLTVGELVSWLQSAGPVVARAEQSFVFTREAHPWLHEHRPGGTGLLPMAAMLVAAQTLLAGKEAGTVLRDFRVQAPVEIRGDSVALRMEAADEGAFALCDEASLKVATGRVSARGEAVAPLEWSDGRPGRLEPAVFYRERAFHGPALQAVLEPPLCSAQGARARLAGGGEAVRLLDGALQLALYWLAEKRQTTAVATAFAYFEQMEAWPADGVVECVAVLSEEGANGFRGDFDLRAPDGRILAYWRGVEARVRGVGGRQALPEVEELAARKAALARAGFAMPYFNVHEGVAGATTRIGGREFINFSSYNYLGFAGHPRVNRAAEEAIARYGTSASASRVASGERPLHAALERELADFLGCADALATVSGHSINVSLLGHLLGPGDLVAHDGLAHDSIVTGARLSGARRLAFPHNDLAALDALLTAERPRARRVLIAVEGVYSMDGDLAPLPEVVALKRKHDALLLVDEAHSLGVLGARGAGAGEHFGVARGEVDLWMGTLSKTLASCGGYVAGDAALIDYLKFTLPGFVYSVGLSPANAAAALEALRLLRADPAPVGRLRARADYFRAACRSQGVDIGASEASAVVPCLTGASDRALRLAQELGAGGINVQPVFHPAVEEGRARLRFFITADHTEAQLDLAAGLLGRGLKVSA